MRKFSIILCLVFIFCYVAKIKAQSKADSENVMIEAVDITVEYNDNDKIKLMEAYRSNKNELILEKQKTNEYGRLEWHSIGSPFLTPIASKKSALSYANIVEMTPTGFNFYVDFLTAAQKDAFKERIKSKYAIDVNPSQIIKLKPSELKCTIELICEDDSSKVIKGSVKSFNEFPLKIEFRAINATKSCFEHYLIEHQKVDIDCSIAKHSKSVKQDYFALNADQISKTDLVDKLFGDANEVYVSRQQMANLATEIYTTFDIYEEYEIGEGEFSSAFVESLIKQTNANFKPVPLNTALKSLSKYSAKDIQPNEIKSMYEKALKIKTVGNKKHIVSNNEYASSQSNRDAYNIGGGANVGVGVFSIGASFNYGTENEKSSSSSSKSLQDQLNELNEHAKDEVEWKIDGSRIIPKNIKVGKLVKTSFKNGLKFERIKRKISNALLSKSFKLEYQDDKIKFEHKPDEKINKQNLNHLKKMTRVKSIVECLEECVKLNDCHYIEQTKATECYLFDKSAHFKLESTEDANIRVYHRKKFARRKHSGQSLKNHFKKVTGVESADKCWEECLKAVHCEAASYDYTKSDCFLSKSQENIIETISDTDFVTFSQDQITIIKKDNKFKVDNVKLTNAYKNLTIISEDLCWSACLENSECVAISFKGKSCLLLKSGEYEVESEYGWVSIAYEKEKLDEKLSLIRKTTTTTTTKTTTTTEPISVATVRRLNAIENKIKYKDIRLSANFKSLDLDSKDLCWKECAKYSQCIAISYGDDSEICRLVTNDYTIEHIYEGDWVTIFVSDEKLQYLKLQHTVDNVSQYMRSNNLTAIYSDKIHALRINWFLEVNIWTDRENGKDERYVGIYLYAKQSPRVEKYNVSFELAIVDKQNQNNNIVKEELVYSFTETSGYGYSKFIKLKDLMNKANLFKSDSFTVQAIVNEIERTIDDDSMEEHEGFQISGGLKTLKMDKLSCLYECLKLDGCLALSYNNEQQCNLIKRGSGLTIKRDNNWKTIVSNQTNIIYVKITSTFEIDSDDKYSTLYGSNTMPLYSEKTNEFDMIWYVSVKFWSQKENGINVRYLGVYLHTEQNPRKESCEVEFDLSIVDKQDSSKSLVETATHKFAENEGFGYSKFIKVNV